MGVCFTYFSPRASPSKKLFLLQNEFKNPSTPRVKECKTSLKSNSYGISPGLVASLFLCLIVCSSVLLGFVAEFKNRVPPTPSLSP